ARLLANTNSAPPAAGSAPIRSRAVCAKRSKPCRRSTGAEQTKIRTPPGIIDAPTRPAGAQALFRRTSPGSGGSATCSARERTTMTTRRLSTCEPRLATTPQATTFDEPWSSAPPCHEFPARGGTSRTSAWPASSRAPQQRPQRSGHFPAIAQSAAKASALRSFSRHRSIRFRHSSRPVRVLRSSINRSLCDQPAYVCDARDRTDTQVPDPTNLALQPTGLSVAALPLAPAAERRYAIATVRGRSLVLLASL